MHWPEVPGLLQEQGQQQMPIGSAQSCQVALRRPSSASWAAKAGPVSMSVAP